MKNFDVQSIELNISRKMYVILLPIRRNFIGALGRD